ncbi:MAG: M1 family metallopeptidase [Deltaproteobacteria bacterium]|nr:M1 family metallopeptidase [Deltaproteobacteria bacterium]
MIVRARTLLSIAVLAACGTGKPAAVAPATPVAVAPAPSPAPPASEPEDPETPDLRLPAGVRPTHYDVDLTLDPAAEDFTGTITIAVAVDAPTQVLWLNATEITVDKATVTAGGAEVAARVVETPKDFLGLALAHPIGAGAATVTIQYRGKAHPNDGDGIYTAKEAGDWYAFTQFESTSARQAFPCFDEPSFKVPWRLTLHTKQALVAVANTPVEAERAEAGGMKAVRFAETLPLPSYLIAFAVGPFDSVAAGATRGGAPIRVVVPRGRGGDAGYPASVTRPILDALEDYFGIPYPYPKLDIVAVSVFNAGAMENPGLITFRQEIVLTKPADMTRAKQERYASVAAHEMAHQWFGDYVTMAWWDDTWLNESFASWMASKIMLAWQPTWDVDVDMVASKSGVMRQDSLDAARAIRQPIETSDDIVNAFDGITYAKGEAVLTMLERWIGPDVFQKGVRAYLAAHAFGNATYDDFVGAMTTAAGRDLHPQFDAFVRQTGVPIVKVELTCAPGAAPTLHLAQRRYAPTGSTIVGDRTWSVPVCVRWGVGATTGRDCAILDQPTGELALSAKACPDWVLPNDGGLGYYRMQPTGALLDHLLARAPKALTLPERVGLLGDLDALIDSGDLGAGTVLGLVATLAKDRSRHIVDASIGIVGSIDDMVPPALRGNYERFIRKVYGARAHELGWQSRPGEPDDVKQLRPRLLSLVADDGHDPALIKEATALAWRWLDDHAAIQPELVGVALEVAARYGDQKLFDRLHADARKTEDREERGRLLGAMAGFIDPAIVAQALALALTDEFELRDGMGLLQGAFGDPRTRMLAYEFTRAHFDEIAAKLPEPFRPYLGYTFAFLCDDAKRPEIEAFFGPRVAKFDGGPRVMAQALEQLTLCAASRKAQTPAVTAFLKKQ